MKSGMSIKLSWSENVYGEIIAKVPARESWMEENGFYIIHAIQRPTYCDRGQYLVIVESQGVFPLDGQEGFPRYYFSLDNLKSEMEAWVNKRNTCLAAKIQPRTPDHQKTIQ